MYLGALGRRRPRASLLRYPRRLGISTFGRHATSAPSSPRAIRMSGPQPRNAPGDTGRGRGTKQQAAARHRKKAPFSCRVPVPVPVPVAPNRLYWSRPAAGATMCASPCAPHRPWGRLSETVGTHMRPLAGHTHCCATATAVAVAVAVAAGRSLVCDFGHRCVRPPCDPCPAASPRGTLPALWYSHTAHARGVIPSRTAECAEYRRPPQGGNTLSASAGRAHRALIGLRCRPGSGRAPRAIERA
jgi:hypothetical protein